MSGLTFLGGAHGQIFVVAPGLTQLTSGTKTNVVAVWCHAEGSITVTHADGSEETHTFTDGDQFAFPSKASVAITTGTWSFMVA